MRIPVCEGAQQPCPRDAKDILRAPTLTKQRRVSHTSIHRNNNEEWSPSQSMAYPNGEGTGA